jgi:hypothetical protein
VSHSIALIPLDARERMLSLAALTDSLPIFKNRGHKHWVAIKLQMLGRGNTATHHALPHYHGSLACCMATWSSTTHSTHPS